MAYKIELTSELLPILDVGMYNSSLSPENIFGHIIECLESDNMQEVDFDFAAYRRDVAEIARRIITEEFHPELCKYGVNAIAVGKIVSPSTYNFSSDYIEIDIHVTDDFCQNMREQIDEWRKIPNWENNANQMIKESWASCSGFYLFMPQNVEEIYEMGDFENEN